MENTDFLNFFGNHYIRNEVSGAEPVGNGFEYKAAATACPMTGIDV